MFIVRSCCAALVVEVALFSTVVLANQVTITFDPNDLIDLAPSSSLGDKTTQENARALTVDYSPVTSYVTWSTCSRFDPNYTPAYYNVQQPDAYNTYMNWLDGLGEGEGISSFNLWILPNGSGSAFDRGWGKNTVLSNTKEEHTSADFSGTAGDGWVAQVQEIYDGVYGVDWYTEDSSKWLRPGGANLGTFSFTVDLMIDEDLNGIGDRDITEEDQIRMWFGCTAGAISFDDQGWGTRPSIYSPFASTDADNLQWDTTLGVTAPEPATLSLIAAAGLFFLSWFRGKKGIWGKKG